jgi:RNA polymerase sigma factor (sigma-70 family)
MATDSELLLRYVDLKDERAFEDLVNRHLGVVYAAALRRTGGRVHAAEEISQKVFSALAGQARNLAHHPTLVGWLYRCANNAALDVMRAEIRRQKLAQTLSTMPDESSSSADVDWDRLRPFLDDALNQLKERDRDVILLRFFSGLTFAVIGERLRVDENTARMQVNRALGKLRIKLGRQGLTSTTAALSIVLANSALASAPAGLASVVSAGAVTSAAAGSATGITTLFLMSKIIAPIVSAGIAAGLVTTLWHNSPRAALSSELAQLHQENGRLTQMAKADEAADCAVAVAHALAFQRAAKIAVHASADQNVAAASRSGSRSNVTGQESPRGHHWAGQATPEAAGKSFAWASDMTDVSALAKLLWFDPAQRERARAILATMPASIQAEYPTPEDFYAFVIAADALVYPPPTPEMVSQLHSFDLGDGRATLRKDGSSRNFQEYQQTPDGWKFVVPAVGVERWPNNLNNELLAKLGAKGSQ